MTEKHEISMDVHVVRYLNCLAVSSKDAKAFGDPGVIVLAPFEIDAIHTYIHANNEPEPAEITEMATCGNCIDFHDTRKHLDCNYVCRGLRSLPIAKRYAELRQRHVLASNWCWKHRPKE